MENYDQRRRQHEERERARFEDRGRDRDSWWRMRSDDDEPPRRERGWLDYDPSYGRGGREDRRDEHRFSQGGREQRYGEGAGGERSNFSPDWSREGAEPFYSDDPYYARNRQRSGGYQDYSRRAGGESWQGGGDRSRWEQRAREAVPREQRELAERSQRGDYYDPDWPYERGGREMQQRSRDDDQGSHYRGWYSRSTTPLSYGGGRGYLFSESLHLHGPYAGRGPKGYKRSDQQIIEEACQRLEQDPHVDASEIEVSAEEGIIRLRGTVPDRQTKRRAEECVETVYGARDVMNELRVERSDQRQGMGSEGSQATPGSQSGRGMQGGQGAQATQSSQGSQGSQAAGTQGTQPGMQGSRSGSSDQQGEGRAPRH